MENDRNIEKLDLLLARAFRPEPGQEASPGFEGRVMAGILAPRRESFWDLLRAAAKPLLVSGWAVAALLGVLALKALGSAGDVALAIFMNGGAASRWLM